MPVSVPINRPGNQGGGGIDRQLDDFRTFFAEFGVQAFTGLGNLIDETSGLTGKTLKDGAALHRFLANIGQAATQMRVAGGIVQPAEPPCDRRSPRRVLKITSKANIPLITLQRQRASTKRSVCGNRDQMGGIVNDLQAVRDLSKNIGFYSRKMWHQFGALARCEWGDLR
jgi:hypothetical protein